MYDIDETRPGQEAIRKKQGLIKYTASIVKDRWRIWALILHKSSTSLFFEYL